MDERYFWRQFLYLGVVSLIAAGTAAALVRQEMSLGFTLGLPLVLLAGIVSALWGRWLGTASTIVPILILGQQAGEQPRSGTHVIDFMSLLRSLQDVKRWALLIAFFLTAAAVAHLVALARRRLMTGSLLDPSAVSEVKRVMGPSRVGEHGKACYHLQDVARKIDDNERNVLGKVQFYKWLAFLVLVALPFIAAVISFLSTNPKYQIAVTALSLAVTLITLLNTLYRPRTRFPDACEMGIKIQQLKDEFISTLEEAPESPQDLHKVCEKVEARLQPFETALIELFLPIEPRTEGSGRNGNNGSGRTAEVNQSGAQTESR